MIIHDDYMPVGWGIKKKLKSASRKISKKVNKPTNVLINKMPVSTKVKKNLKGVVQSNALPKKRDLNNPYARIATKAVATYFGGPAGYKAVDTAFQVYDNRGKGASSALGSIAENYVPDEYKETFNQYKDQYDEIKNTATGVIDEIKNTDEYQFGQSLLTSQQISENYGSIDKSGFSTVSADTTPQTATPANGGKSNMMIYAGLGLAAFFFFRKKRGKR